MVTGWRGRGAMLAGAALVGTLLTGCGGSGGSGSAVAVVTTPTPTASATATTPTPSPSAATYPTYAQLTGDQDFATGCAALRYDFSPALAVPVIPFGTGLRLGYTAATQTYMLTPDARDTGLFGSKARSYGPADRDASVTGTVLSYARTTNGFQERLSIGSNAAAGATPDYVRGFSLRVPLYAATTANPPAAQYSCIFGVPTRTDDLPTAAIAYSRGGLNGSAVNYPGPTAPEAYNITRSTVSVTADPAAGRVTATIHLLGGLIGADGVSAVTMDLGTYTGSATIDRTGFYRGQLTSPDRLLRDATFGGWFFGPQAGEAAFSLGFDSIDQATGRHIIFVGNALALR